MVFNKGKAENNYKVISVKVFAWDRVMNKKRKYRRVFERREINYISVAVEFYNKLFDEKDWSVKISFKAFEMTGGKKGNEICTELKEVTVEKDKNIMLVDFGYGNEEYGKFWTECDYIWEVQIGDELAGEAKFRIEDNGKVSAAENPYFTVTSLRTYEAPKGDLPENERKYLKQFSKKESRYIMSELKIINKLETEWLCELFFNYYDDTGGLIGVSDTLGYITPNIGPGEPFTISAGWGCSDADSWIRDDYRVEVVFMDQVVAMVPFRVGDDNIERLSDYEALLNQDVGDFYGLRAIPDDDVPEEVEQPDELPDDKDDSSIEEKPGTDSQIEIDNRPLEDILADLDKLVGLKDIKLKVREYVDYISYIQYRIDKGIEEDEKIVLHSVFTGNPGTGKTTVVKILGEIFRAMGLLSKGHVHTVESSDLISGYVRQTGKDTKDAIEKARGGILFIDEAYMLFKEGATNDFGSEAVAALITEMSDGPGDIAIMVAGYPAEMEKFIDSNPGLRSRFRNHYHFDDYDPDELTAIAEYAAKEKDVSLSKEARERIRKILTDAFRKRDRTFGNARLAHSLVDEAKMNLGIRLVRKYSPDELTKEQLSTIEAEDVEDITAGKLEERLKLDIDKALLDSALAELDSLVGLQSIKQEMSELVRLTRYYREMDRDVLKAFSMHAIFKGNPGTGKTTVARIIGKIYKALGLLERGHLIDADASDLVAGFVGQSSLKTKDLVDKAMGGVLFIDEAYSITDGGRTTGGDDFGKQAVAALIKEMEDRRGEFAVIAAGYPDNMDNFIESNPGIQSRFDRTFIFEDFNEDELWLIVAKMLADKGLKADHEAEGHIRKFIAHLYLGRNKFFGNARSMRKIVEKAYRNHELRMADLPMEKRSSKLMSTLIFEDVKEFVPEEKDVVNKGIGYKFGSS